jgi:hypothetical protein
MRKGKKKPTLEQLQPLFYVLRAIVRAAGGELEIMPQQLWRKVEAVASDEVRASACFPRGKISLSMSIATLRPVFAAAGIQVTRPHKAEGSLARLIRFKPLDSKSQDHKEKANV